MIGHVSVAMATPQRAGGAFLLLCALLSVNTARAQSARPPADDKTGTNPLNLQQTVWLSNDFASLPDALFVNRAAYRWIVPFAGRRAAASIDLPIVAANITGRTEAAFGDLGARVVWTPWLASDRGVLVGADTTVNTATNAALGTGRHTVAPFAQFVRARGRTIIAPRYGHRVSVGGDAGALDVNESSLGVYLAWLATPRQWVAAEPDVLFDFEQDETRGAIALEYGRLLIGSLGTYVRPRIGLGTASTRPFDWSLELGFRIIP